MFRVESLLSGKSKPPPAGEGVRRDSERSYAYLKAPNPAMAGLLYSGP